ncbi:hypothetical protein V5O48_002484 [Marasmius crinis-equi]|uniref:Uncharacterized protein n=1 Tax=Marasmius crinis-equi TaxID=585013 RepID=A0ABR3FVK9_9AGAR
MCTTYTGKMQGLVNIIVLPTHASSIAVTVCYAGKAITRSFEGGLRFKATSMPPAHAITGVITEFRDLFADWRYWLDNNGVDSGAPDALLHSLQMFDVDDVGTLDDTNRGLIAHLVSPAKAYGFRNLLGRVKHQMQCTHKLQHDYKEYLETEDEWEELLD